MMESKMLLFAVLVINCLIYCHASNGSCKKAALCCDGRDSSCVIQKANANAIIEDLQDQPCYCDHACLKLNDCCSDYRQTCGVQDCQVSDWENWSECDNDCGAGSQSRSRQVIVKAHRGGKPCPPLLQKRACQGTICPAFKASDKATLKETAMLLPTSFRASRRANDTHDIRRNLRFRNAGIDDDQRQFEDYCVVFELVKVSKGCHKEKDFDHLHQDGTVCIRCEHAATRSYLGGRCSGHGMDGRITRWTSLTNVDCHGKWVRRFVEESVPFNDACPCKASFIFV